MKMKFKTILLLISFFVIVAESFATPVPQSDWNYKTLGSIPVQIGGRLKPFDSFARETILSLTGKTKFNGWDPVELMVSLITHSDEWDKEPLLFLSRKDVKRQLGLPEEESRFTPRQMLAQSSLIDYANSSAGNRGGLTNQATPIAKTSKPDPRNEEMKRVIDRASLYRAVVLGLAWQVIPVEDRTKPWESLNLESTHGEKGSTPSMEEVKKSPIKQAYFELFSAYHQKDQTRFESASEKISSLVKQSISGYSETADQKISLELFFNRVHPYQWSWIFYLMSALSFGFFTWLKQDPKKSVLKKMGLGFISIGFALHIAGMLIRVYIADRPPVTNMYESVIWVSFGVILFSLILYYNIRNITLLSVSSVLGVIGLIVADSAPLIMDPGIHPLQPVLRSNMWLTIHVLTITISYAAFALTMGMGNLTLFQYIRGIQATSEGVQKIKVLNQLSYRAIQFGVVLLAAGTILGGVWADYSWGRFWGWDPKEVWALIALMGYIMILHARYTGWMREFGFAVFNVIAFSLVVMAWYGVNFVLGVGLHSYGFSSGGQTTVAFFLFVQTTFVIFAVLMKKKVMFEMKSE